MLTKEQFHEKIAAIKAKRGITIKLLMDVSRTFGCENAMHNYELLKQFPCEDIIGIGLGGAEAKGPAKDFAPVYERALKEGWHAVVHAGEDVGPESIWDSINYLPSFQLKSVLLQIPLQRKSFRRQKIIRFAPSTTRAFR